jgi:hypothetical protein
MDSAKLPQPEDTPNMRKLLIAGGLAAATLAAVPAAADAQVRCVNPQNNTTTGALVGAAGGAAAGSLLAGRHDRGKGALLGALGGAVLGGVVGNQQTRCPDGYYAQDAQGRYYDNNGNPYQPNGYGPPPPPAGGQYGPPPRPAYDNGGYGPPPPGGPGYAGGNEAYWRGAGRGIRERTDFLQSRIDQSVQNGRISRREADNAYADLRDIRRQEYRLRQRDGGTLNGPDRAYLQDRLDRAFRNLHFDRTNGY